MGAPSASLAVDDLRKPRAGSDGNYSNDGNQRTVGYNTYLSLIQQYLTMFQVDNATWLAERCVAEYPKCQEAVYLHALCYYRAGKAKTARHILERNSTVLPSSAQDADNRTNKTFSSMQYLSAQCSYELGEYSRGETALLKETRRAYKVTNPTANIDDWILQTTVSSSSLYHLSVAKY